MNYESAWDAQIFTCTIVSPLLLFLLLDGKLLLTSEDGGRSDGHEHGARAVERITGTGKVNKSRQNTKTTTRSIKI